MTYLDVGPMMVALRTAPEQFELSKSEAWLRHIPSRHSFKFEPDGRVEIRARCDCSLLAIRRGQEQELTACFEDWQAEYWRPLQINKEFASHFSAPSPVRRMLLNLTGKLYYWLLRQPSARHCSGTALSAAG